MSGGIGDSSFQQELRFMDRPRSAGIQAAGQLYAQRLLEGMEKNPY
jgi:hypothetical protein